MHIIEQFRVFANTHIIFYTKWNGIGCNDIVSQKFYKQSKCSGEHTRNETFSLP